jgi:aspartyl protease family protein
MFTTAGAINGIPVTFMVDTGASVIAMNAAVAERLGIAFRHTGERSAARTAGGTVPAWRVILRSVRVGEIERTQVEAMIVEAKTDHDILLGMSFLSTVKMEKQSNLLVLEAQY